ncbi:MAG: flagellar hook-length control protein FliK [Lachnospiraceae bacterium]|nr:flagellar hook-length control protein FliK [Lachnospiraceae bacterium]
MNLGNIFQSRNQNIKNSDSAKVSTTSSGERGSRIHVEIRNYTPGQKIQGEVVAKDGNTVQIAVDKDLILAARLERDLNIALGQNMSFEIKSNNGAVISLTPLYANMANEATILKALSAAGLSQSAENIQMVSEMMKEGMSINRESIAQVSRQLMDFPQANPSSIVQMIRLGLPITELNLQQFEQYKNYNHQMIQSIDQIMTELPQVGQMLLAEGQDAQAVAFYEQIIKAFTEGNVNVLKGNVLEGEPFHAGVQVLNGQEGQSNILNQEVSNSVLTNGEAQNTGTQNTGVQEAVLQNKAVEAEVVMEMMASENTEDVVATKAGNHLADMLQKLGADESIVEQVKTGQFLAKDVLTQLSELFAKASNQPLQDEWKAAFRDLIGNREFQNLLKSEIGNQWLLKPEDVAEKENVEQLYERIKEQTTKINEALQMVGKADTAVARSVQNLQGNVDFMNQMNQLFTYVQLPLKMAGNEAHGDLYVYTNKKNLAKKDGNVSALLHLDMEHLGPLDVYVTMQQSKVNTNFTVQDEATLDLIAEHIHILDERLSKRGYSMNANLQVKESDEEKNIMQEILEQNKNISILSSTSFDMRA